MSPDILLLQEILQPSNAPELTDGERDAFADMLADLQSGERSVLSRKQRAWAEETAARLKPIDATKVPRGREVPTPKVLQQLPKRPPPRRTEEEES